MSERMRVGWLAARWTAVVLLLGATGCSSPARRETDESLADLAARLDRTEARLKDVESQPAAEAKGDFKELMAELRENTQAVNVIEPKLSTFSKEQVARYNALVAKSRDQVSRARAVLKAARQPGADEPGHPGK